jgi:hypothetical protein
MLLVSGREPLKIKLGEEPFFGERELTNSSEMGIPVNKINHFCGPVVVGPKLLEEVFRPGSLA